jgi:hypothetical protein
MSDEAAKDFACVLRKPLDPEALVAAVDRCLRRFGNAAQPS